MRRLKKESGPSPGAVVSKPQAAKISVVAGERPVLELLERDLLRDGVSDNRFDAGENEIEPDEAQESSMSRVSDTVRSSRFWRRVQDNSGTSISLSGGFLIMVRIQIWKCLVQRDTLECTPPQPGISIHLPMSTVINHQQITLPTPFLYKPLQTILDGFERIIGGYRTGED
jgi:hypothetical protein